MAAPQTALDRLVVLEHVSWETYERLLAENQNPAGVRFAYDKGRMEIMVLSLRHESPNRTLAQLVEILAEETGQDVWRAGSTTFKRHDLLKGIEADSSFYLQNVEAVFGKTKLELPNDPPPDLVIEVDVSSDSLDKEPILAALGVPEVWRYDETRLSFLLLQAGIYQEATHSTAFPFLSATTATQFLQESQVLKSTVWARRVRDWVRTQTK